MAAVAIPALIGVAGVVNQDRANKDAARGQELASGASVNFLAKAGEAGAQDIAGAADKATAAIEGSGAEGYIAPFADSGAFSAAQDQILEGLPLSPGIADSIRRASSEFVLSRPEMFNLTEPVRQSIAKNSGFIAEGFEPQFRENLISEAQQELGATGDIAGIRSRKLNTLGDIAAGEGAQRASALVGQTPQLVSLTNQANEARLLSDISGQQAKTQITEQLASFAGNEIERRRR